MNKKQLFDLLESIEEGLTERIELRMDEMMEGLTIDTALEIHKKYRKNGASFLKACFIWEWTPEGHDYWEQIDQKINQELK